MQNNQYYTRCHPTGHTHNNKNVSKRISRWSRFLTDVDHNFFASLPALFFSHRRRTMTMTKSSGAAYYVIGTQRRVKKINVDSSIINYPPTIFSFVLFFENTFFLSIFLLFGKHWSSSNCHLLPHAMPISTNLSNVSVSYSFLIFRMDRGHFTCFTCMCEELFLNDYD